MKKVAAILLVFAGLLLPAVLPNTGSNVTAHAQAFTVVQVNANNVRVRRGPGTNYDALGQVHKGQNFEVVGSDAGEWIKIKYNTNGVKYGYIYHKYVDSHTCYR